MLNSVIQLLKLEYLLLVEKRKLQEYTDTGNE